MFMLSPVTRCHMSHDDACRVDADVHLFFVQLLVVVAVVAAGFSLAELVSLVSLCCVSPSSVSFPL